MGRRCLCSGASPGGTTRLSAKTSWHLRKRLDVALDGNGQAADVGFALLGGDLNNSNSVNVLDYSVMKVNWGSADPGTDVNGDGTVQLLDYSLMKTNWFKLGDPQ